MKPAKHIRNVGLFLILSAALIFLPSEAKADIAFVAASSTGAASGVLTLTINKPTGTAENNVMIASIGVRPNTATITAPAGWTLVRRIDNANANANSLAVYSKVAGASEPASYSWTFNTSTGSAGGIQTFSGVNTATPIDVENGQNTASGLTHATPSVTTTVANTMIVTSHSFPSAATWTPPTGMTEGFDVASVAVPSAAGQSTEGNFAPQSAAGPTGAKTATAANDADVGNAHILALNPGKIGFRAAASAGAASGVLTLTINKPTGTAENNVMIASIGVRPNTATITAPAGWTLVRRIDNANANANSLAVYYKVAGASEPASYSWTFNTSTGSAGGIQTFSGVNTATPIDVENGQNTASGLTHATPSVTTTVANTMIVTSHSFSSAVTWTPPTNMTEGFDVASVAVPNAAGQSTEGNFAPQSAAGSTGTKTATASNDADVGNTHILALKPGAAPTAVKLSSFTATEHDGGALLQWRTGYELNNLGFHIYREENGQRIRLTPEPVAGTALLAGAGTMLSAGQSYSWWDPDGNFSDRYWLEDIDLNGTRTWHGPVTPVLSREALPQRVKPELLSELSRRLFKKYDDFWRGQDLREKLRQRFSSGQVRSAQVVERTSRASAQEGTKQKVTQLHSLSEQDRQTQWFLASRPAVKLFVKEKGWYRVSQSELMAAGLSRTVNPRYLQLYRDGREQAIKVQSQKSGRSDSLSAIEFYGEGLDTPSADTRAYWLVEGARPGKRIEEFRSRGGSSASTSFPFTVERKERTFYFAALKNGEAESFFGPLVTTEPVDQILVVSHLDPSPPAEPVLEVALQGLTNVPHRATVLFNEAEVGEVIFEGQSLGSAKFALPQFSFLDGDNVVTLVSQGGETDVSLIDEIRLTYWHTYTADADTLRFTAQGGARLTIDGFSQSPIRVIDISDATAVQEVAGVVERKGSGYAVSFQAPGRDSRTLLAFTEKQVKQLSSVVANRPSAWHERARADLVIIAHRDFLAQVEPLKALRQGQGLSVALIDAEDLYDEFNFGAKSPKAIKDFLTLTKATWNRPPRFVLLVGDASFDPKNYLGLGNFDLVPTKLVETVYLKTASDDWFVDFNGDGLPEMAVGRLPVRTGEEAATVISKIISYEQGADRVIREALLVADMNDGFDFERASEEVEALLPASIRVQKIFRGNFGTDAEANSALISSLNEGSLLVNYMGHGSVEILRGLLSSDDAPSLINGARLPFFVSMTCLNGFFHDVFTESMAEALLKAEQGGAVAVWASSGLTEPSGQAVMDQELIRLLFNGEPLTLGEATARAKAQVTDPDIRRTWILFGDPTTRLR